MTLEWAVEILNRERHNNRDEPWRIEEGHWTDGDRWATAGGDCYCDLTEFEAVAIAREYERLAAEKAAAGWHAANALTTDPEEGDMKYRSKPVVIEASQWFPGTDVLGVFKEDPNDRSLETSEPDPTPAVVRYFVVTIHRQRAYLDPGDYVITEPDGIHHYPCKPDIFAKRYEPA